MQYYNGDRTSAWTGDERDPLVEKRTTLNSGMRSEDRPPLYSSVIVSQFPNVQQPGTIRNTMPVLAPVPVPVQLVQYSSPSNVPPPKTRRTTTARIIEYTTSDEGFRVLRVIAALIILAILSSLAIYCLFTRSESK